MKKRLFHLGIVCLRLIARALPVRLATRSIYIPLFLKYHGRLPKDLRDPGAGFEDLIASRILDPGTARLGPYADKETAKGLAKALAPEVLITKTLAVLQLGPRSTLEELESFLRPHLGKERVAKPAHVSGKVLLLDRVKPGETSALLSAASQDHFYRGGEAQYRGLAKRILVEESLPLRHRAPPTDYRFHCVRGVPCFGAADAGRFVDLREHHFTVPDYRPVFVHARGNRPTFVPPKPPRFLQMLRIASKLAKPFEYVRIDLYQSPRGVHFGEFTFTPMIGCFKFTDPDFSKWLLARMLEPEKPRALPQKWRSLPKAV